jgi:hypothetical protein
VAMRGSWWIGLLGDAARAGAAMALVSSDISHEHSRPA